MMNAGISFSPIISWEFIGVIAVVVILILCLSAWFRLSGWYLRFFAGLILLLALLEPSWKNEDRENLPNIVLVIADKSESQGLAVRPEQIDAAVEHLQTKIGQLVDFELKYVELTHDNTIEDDGTRLLTALMKAANAVSADQLAGAILITDGQIHDDDIKVVFPAPIHVLLTGQDKDWDRRLSIENAPAYAILGEEILLTLRIDDEGQVPDAIQGHARIAISIDDRPPQEFSVQTSKDIKLPITLPHGGMNVLQFRVIPVEGELTEQNNTAVVSINGVRDRLRVLLVSGEPYAGERTWRNLLKSDAAVDLVHFTILRPPEKQDGVPVHELALIAFPTRELFIEKVDEFDLIIFDRYSKRGLLPNAYLASVINYVQKGGALLVATGPAFAGVNSLYRTPLATILPAQPTARVYDQGYYPTVSELGKRHPVTEGIENYFANSAAGTDAPWGHWFRQIDAEPKSGNVIMNGVDDRPLLLLDRVGQGRIAMLLSDHAWLWSRGFEGGGPQLELLRRLAHWLMQEPDLEEEQLTVTVVGSKAKITRRSLTDENKPVSIIAPNGETHIVELTKAGMGQWHGEFSKKKYGLYRLSDGILSSVFALGPSAPKEFAHTLATDEFLQPVANETNGAVLSLEKLANPKIRMVREGRIAHGRNWIGLVPREAYITKQINMRPLVPMWVLLLLSALLIIWAWRKEGEN